MNNQDLPWAEKYRPSSRKELVGNKEKIDAFLDWILSWKVSTPKKRAALLVGPPGTGKTATVGAIAKDLGYEIVEFNASDKRNKGNIEKLVFRSAIQQTLDGSSRIILLDEVDGLSGNSDRGGVGAIRKIIEKSAHPIVMTANDPSNPRLKKLIRQSIIIEFKSLDKASVITVLHRLADANSSDISDDVIELIASRCGGDLRAAISDLESIIEGHASEAELGSRNVKTSIEQTLRRLFMTTDPSVARMVINQADVDHDALVLWFEENLHLHLIEPSELERGMDSLSIADMYLGRILSTQNWKLLSYAYDFLSSFIATSRTKSPFRPVAYNKPIWPLLIWKGRRKRDKFKELTSRLAHEGKVSVSRAYDEYVRTLELIIENDPKQKAKIIDWLDVKKSIFR